MRLAGLSTLVDLSVTRTRKNLSLAVLVVVCYSAAAVGGLATAGSVSDWFQTLNRPSFQPPDWLFGPVWTVMYGLMAVAAWLVYVKTSRFRSIPMALFAVQLGLNIAWSIIFFGLHRPGLAVLDILLLLVAIIATTIAFWKVSVTAGSLMLPYLAWVVFAAVLNFSLWQLNA